MNRRCDLCEWWVGATTPECKRYPPTIIDNGGLFSNVLRSPAPGDWCGEFTPKGEPLPATQSLESLVESFNVRLTKLEIKGNQEGFKEKP